jgi:uncharacterized FlaG/YvyC family protein
MVALSNNASLTVVAMPESLIQSPGQQPVSSMMIPGSSGDVSNAALSLEKKSRIANESQQMLATLKDAVSNLNDMLQKNKTSLNIQIDPSLSTPVISVFDSNTGELIRTIPNEVVIRVAHSMEGLKGLMHDQIL